MDDPALADKVLANALRIQALPAEQQIALFERSCVACSIRTAFSKWEEVFGKSPFVKSLTAPQRAAIKNLSEINDLCYRTLPCNENQQVKAGSEMADMREAAAHALSVFGWPSEGLDLQYVYGRPECGERLERLAVQQKKKKLSRRKMKEAEPQFHAATFEKYGHPLRVNQKRLAELKAWEAKYDLRLPGAVREWYAMEGPDLWEQTRPRDYVPPLEKLEPLQPAKVRGKGETSTFFCLWAPSDEDLEIVEPSDSYRYLLVSQDTDVGIPCVVRVDGSDDPPIYVLPDGGDALEPASINYIKFHFEQLATEWR